MNRVSNELKKIIEICCLNIKGLTKKEDIIKVLPIIDERISIEENDKKLVFYNKEKILGNVYEQVGCYSNLDILKIITKEYNIQPNNDKIIELLKYKFLIDNIIMKEGN